jgi:hypothetical protein
MGRNEAVAKLKEHEAELKQLGETSEPGPVS